MHVYSVVVLALGVIGNVSAISTIKISCVLLYKLEFLISSYVYKTDQWEISLIDILHVRT